MPLNCADMTGPRFVYLAVVIFSGIFYIAYGQWLSWILLLLVLGLPWFSLLLSLPAMIRFRSCPGGPVFLEMGETGSLWLIGSCPLPIPPFRGRLKLKHLITGKTWYYQDEEDLHTNHCGAITVTPESLRVCDYLGLFSFPCPGKDCKTILILPKPVEMKLDPQIRQALFHSWQPKTGGGYAENHELRLYHPGDSLNQVHWKLSAKTGNLIIRQSMEPVKGLVLLTMNLRGIPEEIDRKLGRLLWLGGQLLDCQIRFELQCLTGEGRLSFPIAAEPDLQRAIHTLLCKKAVQHPEAAFTEVSASWHCHIGGEPDEA